MFVVMRAEATEAEVNGVKGLILAEGLTPFENAGAARTVIAVVGEIGRRREPLRSRLEAMAGVAAVTAISKPYKLVSREFQPDNTVIRILDTVIGDGSLTVMAGPCSVESREQLLETVDFVVAHGANVIRGGAFKPRTSPYSFQGLGVEGLRYLAEARERTGIPVITEVMEPSQVDIVAEYADILQVGTRNMQNFSLLLACGRAGRPVMLKRGFGATIEEWLMAAEYIASAGNGQIILCERGIRTFETSTRNTLDLTAVPLLHHLTHLPVVVDPSHATGKRWLVKPLAIGAVAVGADGIMVEVHPRPEEALSDGEQSLTFELYEQMMHAITGVHAHVRDLHGDLVPADDPAGSGRPALPGDKSISHRALLLALLAEGESRISDAGDGADVRSTAGIVAALGATVERVAERAGRVDYRVVSPGGAALREPDGILDCGNSGTTMRLAAGLLAGRPLFAVLDGDGSLRRRPMGRVVEPLTAMGASFAGRQGATLLPLAITGRDRLTAITYATPVPSAQVKSAILLAALAADGETTVNEAIATRDHTERMLRARGVALHEATGADGRHVISLDGPATVQPIDESVPSDPSGAAFWLVAATMHPDAELHLEGVSTNPTRRAIIDILRRMGADIEEHGRPAPGGQDGEPLADLVVRSSELRAIDLSPADVAEAIDEIPILALAATSAVGTTRIRGAGELRHKESDRIAGIADGLTALGARVRVTGDDIEIEGGTRLRGAVTETHDDHRLAMTFAIAGLIAQGETIVRRPGSAAISYPGFFRELEGVRA